MPFSVEAALDRLVEIPLLHYTILAKLVLADQSVTPTVYFVEVASLIILVNPLTRHSKSTINLTSPPPRKMFCMVLLIYLRT